MRVVGLLLAALGVVCFSLRPLLVKLAYDEMNDPVTLLALRMAIALPFFVVAAAWTRRDPNRAPISRNDSLVLSLLGFLGYYLASMLDFVALQYIPAGISRLLLFTYPAIVVALTAIFLKRPVLRNEVIALVLTSAGIALVLSNTMGGEPKNFALGVGLDFAAAVAFAVYLVAGTEVISRIGSLRFTSYAMIVASLCCIVQFLALRHFEALLLSGRVYAIALAIAVVSTVLPVFMMSEALRRIGPKDVALMGALGPLTVVAFGYFGKREAMTPLQLAGVALVLCGVLVVTLRSANTKLAKIDPDAV